MRRVAAEERGREVGEGRSPRSVAPSDPPSEGAGAERLAPAEPDRGTGAKPAEEPRWQGQWALLRFL